MEPGGVELYRDVDVKFIPGRKAVLTISDADGMEVEKVTLSDYNDKGRLHQLFVSKGFAKYTELEVVERRKLKLRDTKERHDEHEHMQNNPRASPRLRKKAMRDKLKQLEEARENYMMVPPVR